LKTFILRPELLTYYYSYGPRKKYLSPLSLFIILSVIYFLFPLFQTFNSTLNTHMNFGFYSKGAATKVMEYTGGDDQLFKEYMLSFNE
jgi:O-antigen/teichoic acid export membrane protein